VPGNKTLEERILKRIPWEVLLFSLAMGIPASIVFDPLTGLFVLAGGVVSALHFAWLSRSFARSFLLANRKLGKKAVLLYGARLVLILAVFFIIILFFSGKIIAFAAGFSSIIAVILLEAVIVLSRLRTWKN